MCSPNAHEEQTMMPNKGTSSALPGLIPHLTLSTQCRSFLCPRVQTGSAAYSEAAVQAAESVSSRSLSQGTAESVAGSSRDDNVSTIDESPTSRLHYQQVMQSTVMHDCAAFDLQATPREGPGDGASYPAWPLSPCADLVHSDSP